MLGYEKKQVERKGKSTDGFLNLNPKTMNLWNICVNEDGNYTNHFKSPKHLNINKSVRLRACWKFLYLYISGIIHKTDVSMTKE